MGFGRFLFRVGTVIERGEKLCEESFDNDRESNESQMESYVMDSMRREMVLFQD